MACAKNQGLRSRRIPIIFFYLYHLIFIIMTNILIFDYGDALLTISLVSNGIFVFVWTVTEVKKGIQGRVYFHFAAGTAAELVVNIFLFGEVEARAEMLDFSELLLFFYICEIVAVTVVLGILNLIVRLFRRRGDKQAS